MINQQLRGDFERWHPELQTMARRGESSYHERSVELHFQHQEDRIGAKLPIERVVHCDPIFVSGSKARDSLQTSLYALAIRI